MQSCLVDLCGEKRVRFADVSPEVFDFELPGGVAHNLGASKRRWLSVMHHAPLMVPHLTFQDVIVDALGSTPCGVAAEIADYVGASSVASSFVPEKRVYAHKRASRGQRNTTRMVETCAEPASRARRHRRCQSVASLEDWQDQQSVGVDSMDADKLAVSSHLCGAAFSTDQVAQGQLDHRTLSDKRIDGDVC